MIMKTLSYFFITVLFFTLSLNPISSTKYLIPFNVNSVSAEDPDDSKKNETDTTEEGKNPVISEDHKNDLIEYCSEEMEKSDEECEQEINGGNYDDEEVSAIKQENKELADSFGVNHTSVSLLVSAAVSTIGTVVAFFYGGYKFPSNYLSLITSIVILVFFWFNLAEYYSITQKFTEKNNEKSEGSELAQNTINQDEFLQEQIDLFTEANIYLEKLTSTMNKVIYITYGTIAVSIVESILCIVTWGSYCACNQQKNNSRLDLFSKFILPQKVNADVVSDLEEQKKDAEKKVSLTKVIVGVDNWRKIVQVVLVRVFDVYLAKAGAGSTVLTMWVADKFIGKIFGQAAGAAAGRVAAFVKTAFYIVDQVNFYKTKNIYFDAKLTLDERIILLESHKSKIENSLSAGQNVKIGASITNTNIEGFSFGSQSTTDSNLGKGNCRNFDYKNPKNEKVDCTKAKTSFPTPGKIDTSGIGGIKSYMDVLDPNKIGEKVEKAVQTNNLVSVGNLSKNATQGKKLTKRLLKVMKDKKIKFSKDQKKKDVPPLYLQIMKKAKERNNFIAGLTNDLFKKIAEVKGIKAPLPSKKTNKAKLTVTDDKKLPDIPTIKPFSLGEEENEQETKKPTKANYGALDRFESSAEDIVKKKGVSLWKVISVRYQKSAYDDLLELKK